MSETISVYIVETTLPSQLEADALGHALLDQRLCACTHSIPIRSCYRWEGAIHDSDEVLLRIKVLFTHLDRLVAYIQAHHPYQVPELMVSEVSCRSPSYARWLQESS